ncbi:hypothetical protein pb186bvf_013621 [Paramecium bursaria]
MKKGKVRGTMEKYYLIRIVSFVQNSMNFLISHCQRQDLIKNVQ